MGEAGVALARPVADDPTLLPATLRDSLSDDPPAAQRVRLGSAHGAALPRRPIPGRLADDPRRPDHGRRRDADLLGRDARRGLRPRRGVAAHHERECRPTRPRRRLRRTAGCRARRAERPPARPPPRSARRAHPGRPGIARGSVADAHAAARRSLARVTPPGLDRAAHAALLGALAAERDAYDRLARAARRGRRAAWRTARTAATAADRELAAALEGLAAAGYSLTCTCPEKQSSRPRVGPARPAGLRSRPVLMRAVAVAVARPDDRGLRPAGHPGPTCASSEIRPTRMTSPVDSRTLRMASPLTYVHSRSAGPRSRCRRPPGARSRGDGRPARLRA